MIDRQRGYAMVAMLAAMALMAIFALAAAPNIRQQSQREREREAIFRGEQMADAIRAYYRYRGSQGVNSLPTSIEQLQEGIPRGSKKLQILRPQAARDPLSSSGEWRLVSPTSSDLAGFIESLTIYAGGTPPVPQRDMQALAGVIPRVTNVLNTGSSGTAPGGESSSSNSTGPFLGVASRSERNAVRTYYGIDRHDQWIFSPLFR